MKIIIIIITTVVLFLLLSVYVFIEYRHTEDVMFIKKLTEFGKGNFAICDNAVIGSTFDTISNSIEKSKYSVIAGENFKTMYFSPEWSGDNYDSYGFASYGGGQSKLIFDDKNILIQKDCMYYNFIPEKYRK